jgi:hypothetical protein
MKALLFLAAFLSVSVRAQDISASQARLTALDEPILVNRDDTFETEGTGYFNPWSDFGPEPAIESAKKAADRLANSICRERGSSLQAMRVSDYSDPTTPSIFEYKVRASYRCVEAF